MTLLFHSPSPAASDWPQWRGPHRDNAWYEPGIRQTFPTNGFKIRWRAPAGFGHASPVVAGGRVYLFDLQLDRTASHERITCFDESTGRPQWTNAYPVIPAEWAFTPGQESGPNATPVVEDGSIYSIGWHGHLHCLNSRTGEILWKRDLASTFPSGELRTTSSPLIDGDLLILVIDGKPDACVLAVDKHSGREVWRALAEPAGYSSPILVVAAGRRQLIVWTMESITSLDPTTGKTLWRVPTANPADTVVSTPVAADGRLLVGGIMLQLDPKMPAAAILWPENPKPTQRYLSVTSTALIAGNHVYSARIAGDLVCLEAATGRQVWATNKATGPMPGASIHMTQTGDSILLFNDRGELIRAHLAPEGYREISRAPLIEPATPFAGRKVAWSPPAFANGHVFARTSRELVCVSLLADP